MSGSGRTLGVLGGMGPAAGVELVRLFTERWPARRDQDHPRVILLSEPDIPDRSAALRGSAPDPTGPIHAAVCRLAGWGADLVAVPCNTAFAFIDRFGGAAPVPIVHTVATATDAAVRQAPGGVWLLATEGTLASGLYQAHARRRGYRLRLPPAADQAALGEVVAAVKAGQVGAAAVGLVEVTRRVRRLADLPFLLACTELPLAWRAAGRPGRVVDCLDALATACVARLSAAGPARDRGTWGVDSAV